MGRCGCCGRHWGGAGVGQYLQAYEKIDGWAIWGRTLTMFEAACAKGL